MNKIILMMGSIILTFFIILLISPDYKTIKKRGNIELYDEQDYKFRVVIVATLFSLMINFLAWGWFI